MAQHPKEKPSGYENPDGLEKNKHPNQMNAAKIISSYVPQASATAVFHAKTCAGVDWQQYRAVRCCDRIRAGAEHTTDNAGNLPDSEVFSRPKFLDVALRHVKVLGLGVVNRKATSMALSMCSNPAPPVIGLNTVASGFQSHNGARTMTKVNTHPTPVKGITSSLARQQAIENALSMALFHIRQGDTQQGIRAATAKAIRAASLLKQACTEFSINGRA